MVDDVGVNVKKCRTLILDAAAGDLDIGSGASENLPNERSVSSGFFMYFTAVFHDGSDR